MRCQILWPALAFALLAVVSLIPSVARRMPIQNGQEWPVAALDWAERQGLHGRFFAPPDYGSYLTWRLGDRALRLLRALGGLAPTAFECRVFEAGGERYVCYETAAPSAGREEGRRGGGADGAEPAAAAEVTPARHVRAAEPREEGEAEAAARAQSMIARLEALRLREAFQS